MDLKEDQIHEIADQLLCGHLCYVNKTNGNIEYFPQEMDLFMDEEDPWQELKDKIEQEPDNYLRFEPMDSNQSFNVMRDFAETVESNQLQEDLFNALGRPKPFGNFKHLVDNSGEFRQKWFDFRLAQNVLWVEEQTQYYDLLENEKKRTPDRPE